MIKSTLVLHNLRIENGDELPDIPVEEEEEEGDIAGGGGLPNLDARRTELTQLFE